MLVKSGEGHKSHVCMDMDPFWRRSTSQWTEEKFMWLCNITQTNDGGHFNQLQTCMGRRENFPRLLLHHEPPNDGSCTHFYGFESFRHTFTTRFELSQGSSSGEFRMTTLSNPSRLPRARGRGHTWFYSGLQRAGAPPTLTKIPFSTKWCFINRFLTINKFIYHFNI